MDFLPIGIPVSELPCKIFKIVFLKLNGRCITGNKFLAMIFSNICIWPARFLDPGPFISSVCPKHGKVLHSEIKKTLIMWCCFHKICDYSQNAQPR